MPFALVFKKYCNLKKWALSHPPNPGLNSAYLNLIPADSVSTKLV